MCIIRETAKIERQKRRDISRLSTFLAWVSRRGGAVSAMKLQWNIIGIANLRIQNISKNFESTRGNLKRLRSNFESFTKALLRWQNIYLKIARMSSDCRIYSAEDDWTVPSSVYWSRFSRYILHINFENILTLPAGKMFHENIYLPKTRSW